MKLDLDNSFVLKLAIGIVTITGLYYSLFYKIESIEKQIDGIEKELFKNDREQIMIEFRLLQQQVTDQDGDLSEVMKAMNIIMFDVEKIKNTVEIVHQ